MNIIITGASRGIGRAIAEKFAAAGHNLILCAMNEERLSRTGSSISKMFPEIQVKSMAADLSVKEQVIDFARFCMHQGDTDILINNAGVYLPGGLDEADGDVMERLMNTNFYSAYHLTLALLPSMTKKGSGHIFNICSIAALQAYGGGSAYSISKFAMMGFSKNLRMTLMPEGIKVTTIYPGAVETDTWGGFDNSTNRIMLATDIAESVFSASMLSPQAVVEDIIIRPQLGDL